MRFIFLSVFSIVLMVFDHHEHYLATVHSGLNMAVAPIQYIVDTPIKLFDSINTNLASRQALLAENAALRAQQLLLQAKLQKLIALQNENLELHALLKSSAKNKNDHIAAAELLAVSSDPLLSELWIDKGLHDGVYEGQPVLDATGIMGQIIQVGPVTSRILLITDLRSAVPVEDTRNGVRGIVIGQGNLTMLALTDIPDTMDVKPGDLLVTSGLGGRYPEGYPVGVVRTVQHNSGQQFTKIEVSPKAQLNHNQYVMLIWPAHLATNLNSPITKMVHKGDAA